MADIKTNLRLSFSLSLPASQKAETAAKHFVEKLGLKNTKVLSQQALDDSLTHFEVIAQSDNGITLDVDDVSEKKEPLENFPQINAFVREKFSRKFVILGGCLAKDTDALLLDTIFTMSGYLGDDGLERYPMFRATNYRTELSPKELGQAVAEKQADAVIVSKVSSQEDPVIVLRKFLRELECTEGIPKHLVKVCLGPRITDKLAKEIGYDAGFGPGTLPSQVAGYLVSEAARRIENPIF